MLSRLITLMILLITTINLSGCFSSNPENIKAFSMPTDVNVTAETYILQPPDGIQILCASVPEIHLSQQVIRPDGKISFEKLGEIEAAGKTPKQLAETLESEIAEYYSFSEDNPIDVRIAVYQSKVYYVLGQVNSPGPRIYTGRDTFLTAITLAQPNPMAWMERIQVIRPSNDKDIKPEIFEVNLDLMMAHGDTSKNVLLEEGDIIYVPPTVLAWISLRIEEIIRPIARAFSGYYIIDRGTDRPYSGL